MINTYKVNRKIRKTYDKNAFIYMISLIPLIGDLVTNKTYNSKNLVCPTVRQSLFRLGGL